MLAVAALVAVAVVIGWWAVLRRPCPPAGVSVRAPDGGGAAYYDRFANGPHYPNAFPLGIWLASARTSEEVRQDREAGINTYVGLSGDSKPEVAADGGMAVLLTADAADADANRHQGWLVSDEVDMWAGAGDAAWTGRRAGQGAVCDPPGAKCGFTVQRRLVDDVPRDGRLRFANYGKGVLFWATDADAKRFANDYQDVVAVDAYWYTDAALCQQFEGGRLLDPGSPKALGAGECHRGANYGKAVERVRQLVEPAGSKPVWGFVELGRPGPASPAITPAQVRAAVWQSIIHGARGIVYFNHSFAAECRSTHLLRDPCWAPIRQAVTDLNAQVTRLAGVLDSADVTGLVRADEGVNVLVKRAEDDLVVVAAGRGEQTDATMRSGCRWSGDVEVVDEQRTLRASDGSWTDRFANAEAVHVYRLPGAAADCGIG